MASYITLENSNASLSKRFRVLQIGYRRLNRKIGARRQTVTGKVDNQVGSVHKGWIFTLKVYATDPVSSDYGTLANLETFHGYDNPGGTPSDVITLTDHEGNSHSIYIVGDLEIRPQTPALTGTRAEFHVDTEFIKTTSE